MKFFSLSNIYDNAAESMRRFYMPLFCAVAGAILSIALVESTSEKAEEVIPGMILTCVLTMNFSFGGMLYVERRKNKSMRILLPVISILLALIYWHFGRPDFIFEDIKATLLFAILFIIVHLWVAVAAYVNIDEKRGFWHFNEALFLRIITGATFSLVLFGGLALAIFALQSLFNYPVNERMYVDLWIVVVAVFNTWFFLSGVPRYYEQLNQITTFPKGLKIFVQYILIPLAIIYLLILYAYSAKILIEWNLPNGWVSMLVLWYAVFGILAILLAFPLRDDSDNPWVRLYSRFFFVGLLPLILLLFIAVGVRIGDYGVTELRYYVLLLGLWLLMMAAYFIFSKEKNIKLIPLTLIGFGVLSLFGPWSVFSISESSQASRFETLILKNKIWEQDKGFIKKDSVAQDDLNQIESIIDFFVDRGTESELSPYFKINFDSLEAGVLKGLPEYEQEHSRKYRGWALKNGIRDSLYTLMQLDQNGMVEAVEVYYKTYNANPDNQFVDINGYSFATNYSYTEWGSEQTKTILVSSSDSILVAMINNRTSAVLRFYKGNITDSISLMPLMNYIKGDSYESDTLTMEKMTMTSSTGKYKLVLQSISINGTKLNHDKLVERMNGMLMMK